VVTYGRIVTTLPTTCRESFTHARDDPGHGGALVLRSVKMTFTRGPLIRGHPGGVRALIKPGAWFARRGMAPRARHHEGLAVGPPGHVARLD
jgi:hypothetical protein